MGAAGHGTVTINDNGTAGNTADDFVVYTPDAGYSGDDMFSYTVTSGGLTETTNVSVTVNAPANAAPIANHDSPEPVRRYRAAGGNDHPGLVPQQRHRPRKRVSIRHERDWSAGRNDSEL